MQLIGQSTAMSGYSLCTLNDGDYDVYMDSERSKDVKDNQGQRIRKIVLCFTVNLHSMKDGPSEVKTYGDGYIHVPGGRSDQMYFGQKGFISRGLPREWYMEHALEFRYGKLHVEKGQAINLTIPQKSETYMFSKKSNNKDHQTMVLLDDSRQVSHLTDIGIDYFESDEEYKQLYLEAAKRLNAGLFKPEPTPSSSTELPTWGEIFGFSKKGKTAKTDIPQASVSKEIPAKKVTNENRPNAAGASPEKKRSKFNLLGRLNDKIDAKVDAFFAGN
jgi:hypothetical protein